MRLQAGCEIVVDAEDDCAVVAMLRPRSNALQWLVSESWRFTPQVRPDEYIDTFGNVCQRFVVPRGRMTLRAEIEVETDADVPLAGTAPATPPALLPHDTVQFLLPSRYCPSDRAPMWQRALSVVGDATPGYAQAEAIRAWIHTHLAYRYGTSDSSTDAQQTLEQGAGVCRDFAHVGITLCRALDIPARMVVGWLHDLKPMDLHAWFEAYLGDTWYAFDATQAAPRGGRVVIAHGRDAADVAFLTSYRPLRTLSIRVWTDIDGDAHAD